MFHRYPYTDFHELNLDGLLAEWKKFLNEYDDVRAKVETLEDAFNSLKDFVNNYFDNLDVQEEINNKLDDMFESGQLDVVLQRIINTSQVMALNPAISVSVYRGRLDQNNESAYPNYMQSACTDGAMFYMFFNDATEQSNRIHWRKYSVSGKVFAGSGYINGGYHANGCDYFNGKIYMAPLDVPQILEIDPESMTITATHVFDRGFRAVTIDNDGQCYAMSGGQIFKVDLSNDTYEFLSTIDYVNTAYQSGCVRDGWLYEPGVNPSCVYRVNVATGQTSRIYPVERYIDMYCVGELETMFADRNSGKFYLASCSYYNFSNYRIGNIFECDFATNTAPVRTYAGGSVLSVGTIYVDQGNTNGLPNGSANSPFGSLAQALAVFNSPLCDMYRTMSITLNSDCADEIFYVRRNNISLSGAGHKIGQIYGVLSNVEINNVIVQKNNLTESAIYYPVYFNSSNVDIDGLTIDDNTAKDYTYAINFNECTGTLYNMTLNSEKDGNFYRSMILTQPSARTRITFDASYNPNYYFGSNESMASMTPALLANVGTASNIMVRVGKGTKYTYAVFPPGGSITAQVNMYVGNQLEFYDIRQTFTEGSGYTYAVVQARALAGVSETGTITHIDVDPPTLGSATVISRWS